MRFIVSIFALLSLTACQGVYSPAFLPSGYAHHQDIYKSPPEQGAHDIGYMYSPLTNQTVLNEWRLVADDFVRRLENETSLNAPDIIYLDSALAPSTLQQTFGYALADVLRERGFTLAKPSDQYRTRLSYAVRADADFTPHSKGNVTYGGYTVTGDLYTNDPSPVRVQNTYTAPAFDAGIPDDPAMRADYTRTRNMY